MFTVALVGPDGAGKTTIARRLLQEFPRPMEYLYMGINIESSNVALPTSRLIEKLKRRGSGGSANGEAKPVSLHQRPEKARSRGKVWSALRLLNRIAEEWYRQVLSWRLRRQGKIVLYDRHFRFDFEFDPAQKPGRDVPLSDWLHRWHLAKLYPAPDLVIYLDAPAELLYARKREAGMEYLEARRQAILRQGERLPNFVRVDASQPLDAVYAAVAAEIHRFCQRQAQHPLAEAAPDSLVADASAGRRVQAS